MSIFNQSVTSSKLTHHNFGRVMQNLQTMISADDGNNNGNNDNDDGNNNGNYDNDNDEDDGDDNDDDDGVHDYLLPSISDEDSARMFAACCCRRRRCCCRRRRCCLLLLLCLSEGPDSVSGASAASCPGNYNTFVDNKKLTTRAGNNFLALICLCQS